MAIQMTRGEYEAKYGVRAPAAPAPVRMTQAEYDAKYGTPANKPLPLLTNEKGGVPTAAKDIAVGALKGFTEGTRFIAGGLQKIGQTSMGLLGFDTKNTGFKSLDSSTQEGQGVDETLRAKSKGEQVGKVLQVAADLGFGFTKAAVPAVNKIKTAVAASKEVKATERIAEMITPKPTVKEAKLAQSQGRLVKGKEPTPLRSGTDDIVIPTQKQLSATETIKAKIPNASKMNPSELFNAVDTEITKTAENLRPVMKKTPIKPDTIQKINTDWDELKKLQIKNADATEEANVLKLQSQFEERLMKSGNASQDDLWQARIDYDNRIPDNVKRANELSSETLQNKKEIWLQNRAILNDAITDTSSGLGDIPKKAFDEMSNLYEARTNLLSKAKIEKAKASKLKQLMKKYPELTGALSALLGLETFRRLTGI